MKTWLKNKNVAKSLFAEKRFVFEKPAAGPTGKTPEGEKTVTAAPQAAPTVVAKAGRKAAAESIADILAKPNNAEAVQKAFAAIHVDLNLNFSDDPLKAFKTHFDANLAKNKSLLEAIDGVDSSNVDACIKHISDLSIAVVAAKVATEKKALNDFLGQNSVSDSSQITFNLKTSGVLDSFAAIFQMKGPFESQFNKFKSERLAARQAAEAAKPEELKLNRSKIISRIKMMLGPFGFFVGLFFKAKKKPGDDPDFIDGLISDPPGNEAILGLLKMPGYESVNPIEGLEGSPFAATVTTMMQRVADGTKFGLPHKTIKSLTTKDFMSSVNPVGVITHADQVLTSYHPSLDKRASQPLKLVNGRVVIPAGMTYRLQGEMQTVAKKNTELKGESGRPVTILYAEQLAVAESAQFQIGGGAPKPPLANV
jgi:hypothetical protein